MNLDQAPGPDIIIEQLLGCPKPAALNAALKADLFTLIARGSHEPAAMAARTGHEARRLRILCDYLAVNSLLEKRGAAYRLTPASAAFLDARSPDYIGVIADFLASGEAFARYLSRPERFLEATAGRTAPDAAERAEWVVFAKAMGDFVKGTAEQTAAAIAAWLEPPTRILDIAAGSGVFSRLLARSLPTARFTLLDLPEVIEQSRAENAGDALYNRSNLVGGDAFDVDWGEGYDLVLLSNFLHHFSSRDCGALFRKARRAITNTGQVAVVDFVPDEARLSPPFAVAFAFNMLVATAEGDTYTRLELEAMAREAGLVPVSCQALANSPASLLVYRVSSWGL